MPLRSHLITKSSKPIKEIWKSSTQLKIKTLKEEFKDKTNAQILKSAYQEKERLINKLNLKYWQSKFESGFNLDNESE